MPAVLSVVFGLRWAENIEPRLRELWEALGRQDILAVFLQEMEGL
jgi:hypothetical protein